MLELATLYLHRTGRPLARDAVFKWRPNPIEYGRLAEYFQALLLKYLAYARDRFLAGVVEMTVSSEELKEALHLDEARSQDLRMLIELSNMGSWGGSHEQWTITLPRDVDELPQHDLLVYVHTRATADYRADMPVEAHRRYMTMLSDTKSSAPYGEFDFVADPALRQLIEADWREAQQVQEAGAWKSCVVLCGSVLEGLLLDALAHDQNLARSSSSRSSRSIAPNLDRWSLSELVDVASEIGVLEPGAVHLGRALREFRNLVHPGRQVRVVLIVTKEEAEVAVNVVKICVRSLTRRQYRETREQGDHRESSP